MLSLLGFDEDPRVKLQRRYGLKAPNLSDEEVADVFAYIRNAAQPVRGFSSRIVYTHLLTQAITSGAVNVVSILLPTSVYQDRPLQWIRLAIQHRRRGVVMLLLAEGSPLSYDSLALYTIEERRNDMLDLIVHYAMMKADPLALSLLAAVETQVVQPVNELLLNAHATTSGVLCRAIELNNIHIVRALLNHPSCDISYRNYAAVDSAFTVSILLVIEVCGHSTYNTQERHLKSAIHYRSVEVLKLIIPRANWSRQVVIDALKSQDDEIIDTVIRAYCHYWQEELVDVLCEYDSFLYLDRLCEYTSVDYAEALTKAAHYNALQCLNLLLEATQDIIFRS